MAKFRFLVDYEVDRPARGRAPVSRWRGIMAKVLIPLAVALLAKWFF